MLCDFKEKTKLVTRLRIMAGAPHPAFAPEFNQLRYRQMMRRGHQIPTNLLDFYQSNLLPSPLQSLPVPLPPEPSRREPEPQPLPPGWTGSFRSYHSIDLETIVAASWNNFYPGETRVKLDYTRMISFYDPSYTSLVIARRRVGRTFHRLTNISSVDFESAMGQLDEDFKRVDGVVSGVNWSTLTRTVTDRYADRLYLLKTVLEPFGIQYRNVTEVALSVREHLMIMLTPYLVYGAVPPSTQTPDSDARNLSWVEPIREQCIASFTSGIKTGSLTRSELVIKSAIDGVLYRICSTLTGIWADAFSISAVSEHQMSTLLYLWKNQLETLMRWLDWPMWDICRPSCSEEVGPLI